MTPEQIAAFSISNDFYMWGGVILGLILSGFFKAILNIFAHRFERPKRIKFRNLNGREERKDNFEYLYLFNRDYYTLEQRDFLVKERLKNIKSIARFKLDYFFMFVLVIALMTYLFFFNLNLSI